MSNELQTRYVGGGTVYATIRRADGQIYNGSGLESPLTAHWGTYAVTMTQQDTTGYYYGNMPSLSAGLYNVDFFSKAGGSPATTDPLIGQAVIDWSGGSDISNYDVLTAVSGIAVTGAALNIVASSLTLSTGTDSGGLNNTFTLDGTYDTWTAVGGAIDGYYQFNLSGTVGAVAVGVNWTGYLTTRQGLINAYAWNWGNSAWDQIGSGVGSNQPVPETHEVELTNSHTGTGGNLGLVRIRFQGTGLGSNSLNTERILLGYAVVLTPPANWASMTIDPAGGVILSPTGIGQVWTPVLSESYAAVHTAFTPAQALYEICQAMTDIAISGTTLTAHKRDGTTPAATYALDSASNPTSRTRAS